LYGCETWHLSLREEHKLRSELRKIPDRGNRRLKRTAYLGLLQLSAHSSQNGVRVTKTNRKRWAGYIACMGQM
jgi:hypothetical protein